MAKEMLSPSTLHPSRSPHSLCSLCSSCSSQASLSNSMVCCISWGWLLIEREVLARVERHVASSTNFWDLQYCGVMLSFCHCRLLQRGCSSPRLPYLMPTYNQVRKSMLNCNAHLKCFYCLLHQCLCF